MEEKSFIAKLYLIQNWDTTCMYCGKEFNSKEKCMIHEENCEIDELDNLLEME